MVVNALEGKHQRGVGAEVKVEGYPFPVFIGEGLIVKITFEAGLT